MTADEILRITDWDQVESITLTPDTLRAYDAHMAGKRGEETE
jgi:hypothetical protein